MPYVSPPPPESRGSSSSTPRSSFLRQTMETLKIYSLSRWRRRKIMRLLSVTMPNLSLLRREVDELQQLLQHIPPQRLAPRGRANTVSTPQVQDRWKDTPWLARELFGKELKSYSFLAYTPAMTELRCDLTDGSTFFLRVTRKLPYSENNN